MVIKYIEDIRGSLSIRTNFIRSANVLGLIEGTLLLQLTEEDEPEALRLLNSISNRGIERIDFNRFCYTVDGITLAFSQFRISELLFLLAYAADKTKTEVYFYNDINRLSDTVLTKFVGCFYSSPYVNIAYKSDLDTFYNHIVGEETGNDKRKSEFLSKMKEAKSNGKFKVNLIVGESSVSKNLYLNSLVKTGRELTNLENLYKYEDIPYDKFRVEGLRTRDICEVDTSNPCILNLVEPNRPLTFEFIKLVTLMCKEGDVLLLDEPEKDLLWYENYYFISFLLAVASSFKEVYIATYDDELLDLSFLADVNLMAVKKGKDGITPYNITMEQAEELIDKI